MYSGPTPAHEEPSSFWLIGSKGLIVGMIMVLAPGTPMLYLFEAFS